MPRDPPRRVRLRSCQCPQRPTITCTVVDASITGNVATNVIATPSIVVGFVGAELVVDPAYMAALERCYAGMLEVCRGASPQRSSGRPTTATSATAGWR